MGKPYTTVAAAIRRNRSDLMTRTGVLGVGIGTRRKDGADTGAPSVVLFVRKKLTPAALKRSGQPRIPRQLQSGRSQVATDVVQLGRLTRLHGPGGSIGPLDRAYKGSIGCVAVSNSGGSVALTAMHVCKAMQYPGGPPIPMYVPSRLDDTNAPVVGQVDLGTRVDIDSARIRLQQGQNFSNRLPDGSSIQGWRPVVYPGDRDIPVQLYGANSGYRLGTLRYMGVDLPQFQLREAILVEIDCQKGDSGAGLLDMHGFLLGFLVGQMDGSSPPMHAFSPASLVLARLQCDVTTVEET